MKFENALESEEVILYNESNSYLIFKKIMNFIISFIALVTLSPILLIISLIIKIDSEGPVIYKHYRLGKNGKVIGVYKFRTMVKNADEVFRNFTKEQKEEYEKFFKLENDPRITRVGDFLRKTSLDELPQMINILKGEMSIVGPRAEWVDEVEIFAEQIPYHHVRYYVKAGWTGWSHINMNPVFSVEEEKERLAYDIYYMKHRNVLWEIGILVKAVFLALGGRHK